MPPKTLAIRRASLGDVSRRDLLTGALAGAAAFAASGSVAGSAQGGKAKSLAYVGCYTPNGLGIYLFGVEADGDLNPIKVFTTPNPSPTSVSATNPSWLAFNPAKTHLYVANEIGNFDSTPAGAVSAFSVNQFDGELTFLNTVSSEGGGPAHLTWTPQVTTSWCRTTAAGIARPFLSSPMARSGRRRMCRRTLTRVRQVPAPLDPPSLRTRLQAVSPEADTTRRMPI